MRPGAGAAMAGRPRLTSENGSCGRRSARSNSLSRSTARIAKVSCEVRQAPVTSSRTRVSGPIVYRIIALGLCALFLRAVAEFYHPETGFTALIGLPPADTGVSQALRAVPYYSHPASASYDGQFYVQRALDPLVRDPDVDHAMDLAPFRARRILFSWTAYALGAGRPAWILEAYALQNVVCWLVLAALLVRWFPLRGPRDLALWTACLFSHGLLWSVRFSLLDGPSLVLIVLAVIAVERGRPLLSAAITGVSGLGRETNVLAFLAQPWPRGARGWARGAVAAGLALLPLLVWQDYLRSIYRSTSAAASQMFAIPGSAYLQVMSQLIAATRQAGILSLTSLQLYLLLALSAQALYLVIGRDIQSPWWRIGAGYVLMALLLDRYIWDPVNGGITGVLLPLTVGFNVLLSGEKRPAHFWMWFAAGNLHLLSAPWVMPVV